MKKLLLLAVAVLMLTMSIATPLMALDDETCPCGQDDKGECLPCDEVE